MRDSAVSSCFHGSLAFLHQHFPPQSLPSHPLHLSLCSQQQPSPWDCSTISKLQLPATTPSRGPAFLSRVCMAVARTVWFSFHLGCHRSAVSLSALNVSPLAQITAPMWGLDPCFSSPTGWGSSPTNTLVFLLVLYSYQVLYGSIYSSPLIRYSCPLSAGVPYALLCLKVYFWGICGERCIPHLLTPPPSCSPVCSFGQVQINLLWPLMCKSLYWYRFSFIFIKYLSVKWLDHVLHVYLLPW